jgi:hypothetical protein
VLKVKLTSGLCAVIPVDLADTVFSAPSLLDTILFLMTEFFAVDPFRDDFCVETNGGDV